MSLHDVIETHVLGAFRLIDNPTQGMIKRPMNVFAPSATCILNRSYNYVIIDTGRSLSGNVDIHIYDPLGRYIPRILTIALPRDPDPDHADQNNSLFQAVPVQMYAAPTFPMYPNWSGIRASLTIKGSEDSVPGALLRVIRSSDDAVLARGISDRRGETLVVVPGIPITNFTTSEDEEGAIASGPVVISETAVAVELIVNEALPWPVNPDESEINRSSWIREGDEPIVLSLRAGQIATMSIEVDMS